MSLSANDERPGGNQGASSSNSSDDQRSARSATPTGGWHVVPRATSVRAGSGRDRWSLLYKCPCRLNHEVYVRELSSTLRRKTPCGYGWVTLHLDALAAAA